MFFLSVAFSDQARFNGDDVPLFGYARNGY